MKILFENWRQYLEEEELLEEGLWDSIKADVISVFTGMRPDATISYLLDKLNDTRVIKNLKGKKLASFLSLSKKLQSKSTEEGEHSARQIEIMKRAAIQYPDLTLDELIQDVSMKHVRTPEERKKVVMKGLNSFLGNLASVGAEIQKADPTPGLAEENTKSLFENWRKFVNETEEGEGGKIHIQARAREDADPENPYQMAEYVITLPGGEQKVVPNQESFENGIGGTIGIAFYNAYDLDWNKTPENKIPGFKGPTLPGGITEDGSLLDNERGDFQIYIDGFYLPKVGPASDELVGAFSNIRSVGTTPHKPHSGESSRKQYYDTYKEMPGRGYDSSDGYDRRNFR